MDLVEDLWLERAAYIEKLEAELAVAKAEIDDLVKVLGDKGDTIREKDKQLAARDLVISKMREAFEKIDSRYMSLPQFACEALALQPTTEALDAYVQEQLRSIISQNVIEVQRAKEEVRDKCAAKCESLFDKDDDTCDEAEQCAAAIRGMEL